MLSFFLPREAGRIDQTECTIEEDVRPGLMSDIISHQMAVSPYFFFTFVTATFETPSISAKSFCVIVP
jgi:hypothetical protein